MGVKSNSSNRKKINMSKEKFVSVIIINWNGKHFLEECLKSLYRQSYKTIEVIIVDNGSTDGSIEFIEKKYPKAIVIKNSKNKGFAEANNQGFRIAHGEYILFLNNDTKVTNNFLTNLVKKIETNPKIGVIQSKILLMDSPEFLDSVGGYLTPTGFLYHYGINKKVSVKYSKEIAVFSAKGACMLLRKSVGNKIALNGDIFDKDYFAYFEETDMCHRVWIAGYTILFDPESVIYHKMGGTSSKMDNAFIQFHSYKNRIRTYIKNLEAINLIMILLIHVPICIGYSFVYLCSGKVQLFYAIYKAFFWNLKYLPQTIELRVMIQTKIRRVKDASIYPFIMKHPRFDYYYHMTKGLADYED